MDFDEKKIEAKIICSHGKMFLPLLPDWRRTEHYCSMMQESPVAKQSSEATTTLILLPKQITSSSETLDKCPRDPPELVDDYKLKALAKYLP